MKHFFCIMLWLACASWVHDAHAAERILIIPYTQTKQSVPVTTTVVSQFTTAISTTLSRQGFDVISEELLVERTGEIAILPKRSKDQAIGEAARIAALATSDRGMEIDFVLLFVMEPALMMAGPNTILTSMSVSGEIFPIYSSRIMGQFSGSVPARFSPFNRNECDAVCIGNTVSSLSPKLAAVSKQQLIQAANRSLSDCGAKSCQIKGIDLELRGFSQQDVLGIIRSIDDLNFISNSHLRWSGKIVAYYKLETTTNHKEVDMALSSIMIRHGFVMEALNYNVNSNKISIEKRRR